MACPPGLVKVRLSEQYAVKDTLYFKNNPSLSEGDKVAGRRAFIDSHCIDCHRVAEDPHLPRGMRAIAEPPLAHLDRYKPKALYDRILDRNTGKGVTLHEREMGEYVERLSARQLVDIVAYLRDPKQIDD